MEKKAKLLHPDNGGDHELFTLVHDAYEQLIEMKRIKDLNISPQPTPPQPKSFWSQHWFRLVVGFLIIARIAEQWGDSSTQTDLMNAKTAIVNIKTSTGSMPALASNIPIVITGDMTYQSTLVHFCIAEKA